MIKTPQEIAIDELETALNHFADYLQGIRPDLSKAENVMLVAAIINALPRFYEDNPPLRKAVDDTVKKMRGEA